MRSLTTPFHNLPDVVRDDKGLYINKKRGWVLTNYAKTENSITAQPRFPLKATHLSS